MNIGGTAMQRAGFILSAVVALFAVSVCPALSQEQQAQKTPATTSSTPTPDPFPSLPPLENPATVEQIHKYLQLSGELDAYRARWIASVDKNRSIGAPYWPEEFWTAVKDEMRKTDLMPMNVAWYQHTVSKDLMQKVLDAYARLGADHFQGSPESIELAQSQQPVIKVMEHMTLANTQTVVYRVYAIYKPKIKAARAQYLAEHPGWVDK
jgi:hypothetical protein